MKTNVAAPVLPPARIGIIGGGQLARMMACAAFSLGYDVHVYSDRPDDPALRVTPFSTIAPYTDEEALKNFALSVDVATYEFENLPATSLEIVAALTSLRPGAPALRVAQHRLKEKTFANARGVPTALFVPLSSADELWSAYSRFGENGVVKTCTLGYDGKGQTRLKPGMAKKDVAAAWNALNVDEAIWENFVPFVKEFSVTAARGAGGEFIAFPPAENIHKNGILYSSAVPAAITEGALSLAVRHTKALADTLEYVGVMAAEYFLLEDGAVLLNEIAPRPHNSAHWTADACMTGQFEQHIRAVCGLPLGATDLLCSAFMYNLIGKEAKECASALERPFAKFRFYGKTKAAPERKMGHVTELTPFS
ncbi:MAG: 5-(carboxyamino)imidazole ribonucleotide synthase [Rickettsiales bacterium]